MGSFEFKLVVLHQLGNGPFDSILSNPVRIFRNCSHLWSSLKVLQWDYQSVLIFSPAHDLFDLLYS